MGKIGEAWVEVSSKTKLFDKGLDDSKGKLTEWVGHAQKLVAAFVIAKVGQEFLSFLGSATKAASDLAESANKAQTAFGDAFPKMSAFADEMATKFGVVKTEIYDLTAGLGFMLTNAGLAKTVAADLAIQLAKSAMDVSSIQNMSVGTVLEKMRAGISGEAEPLRPLGVNVSQENVEKQAAKMGVGNKDLTDQQKILARIALIVGGLNYAQGDLEKTIAEYANATRKAEGDWINLKAEIGEKVKPVMLELIKAGYDLGAAFKDAFGTAPLESFASAMDKLKGNISSAKEWFGPLLAGLAEADARVEKYYKLQSEGKPGQALKALFSQAEVAPKPAEKPKAPDAPKESTAERNQRIMGGIIQRRFAQDYEREIAKPGRNKLSDLSQGWEKLKDAGAKAMAGPLGGIVGGYLTGGLRGAVKGAGQSGLLNQLIAKVAPPTIGPLSSHIMGGSDFANFAQERVSGHLNEQIEAAKEAAKNTAETVTQIKEVGIAIKGLADKFTGKARLAGP